MVRLVTPFAVLALAILLLPLPAQASGETRVIELNAAAYEFAPGRVQVNSGDTVIIELSASDVVHGFYLDGYGIKQRVTPGVTERIEFVADRPGKFRYRCSVSCGPLHPFMIGELVVGPNIPFWRTVGVMLTAVAAMLTYLWKTKESALPSTQLSPLRREAVAE
jgi:heme/copper-type cytochrome/quinol oxidase subunit 2